jgi:PhnB protein
MRTVLILRVPRCLTNGYYVRGKPRETTRFIFLRKTVMAEVSISPMLSVRRGLQALAFYKAAFGAIELFRVENPAGEVVARLSVEGAEFWVSDESPAHENFSPESLGGSTARIILTVPDPDVVYTQAVAAGARVIAPVEDAYGWRVGRVVDPFGHQWEIGRPVG